jgi:hypothetical protein
LSWGADIQGMSDPSIYNSASHTSPSPQGPGPQIPPEFAGLPVYDSILRAMETSPPGHPLAVVVRITSVKPPSGARRQPGDPVGYSQRIFLSDLCNNQIETRPCTDIVLCQRADRLVKQGGLAVVYGRYLEDPPRRGQDAGGLRFQIEALRTEVRCTERMGATAQEIAAARVKLDELAGKSGALMEYIQAEQALLDGVCTESMPERFKSCLNLALLQVASDGQVLDDCNPRLQIYVLSEPGQGKGVIGKFTKTVASIVELAKPSMTSLPGLSLRMEQRQGQGYISTPGAMARADREVCLVEDMHRAEGKELKEYHAVMLSVAEDGILRPAKVSHMPYQAQAAIQINGNHRHVIEGRPCPKGVHQRLADIGMALDVFSRIDVVMSLCIGDDIDRVARELVRMRVHEPMDPAEKERRRRMLKVMVALLRDEIPQVDLTPVEDLLEGAVARLQRIVREYAAQAGEEGAMVPAAMSLRMARGLRKLAGAFARLDGVSVANEGHVRGAEKMMGYKLEVLKWVCGAGSAIVPQGTVEQQERRVVVQQQARQQQMMDQFGGQQVAAEEIAAGLGKGARTVSWDLRQMGIEPVGGKYAVPTAYQWEKHLQELERQGKEVEAAPAPNPEDLMPKLPEEFRPADSLGKVAPELRPAVRAMEGLPYNRQESLARDLLRYVTAAELTMPLQIGAQEMRVFYREGAQVPQEASQALARGLCHAEWAERARVALLFYTHVTGLPTVYGVLEGMLARQDVPSEVKRHIESALRRRAYLDEQERKGLQVKVPL